MDNVKRIISKHNFYVLSKKETESKNTKCNCRDKAKCPLKGNCLAEGIIYQANVTTTDGTNTKQYIGMAANSFKQRYSNHLKSFRNEKYAKQMELSKHIWDLKRKNMPFSLTWSVLNRAATYSARGKRCNLCLEEKLMILKADKRNSLNKRAEIISKCRHKNRFYVKSFCRRKNAVTSSLSTYQPVIQRLPEIINTSRSGTSLVALRLVSIKSLESQESQSQKLQ